MQRVSAIEGMPILTPAIDAMHTQAANLRQVKCDGKRPCTRYTALTYCYHPAVQCENYYIC
jgi:hypothetical protein